MSTWTASLKDMIILIKQTLLCLCNWDVMGLTVVWNGISVGQI